MEHARKKLSKGKALGVDYLPDRYFKDPVIWDKIQGRIKDIFNEWSRGSAPNYLNRSNIIPISKDKDSPLFPATGDVRTIAVLPSISKFYELCILQRLTEWTNSNKILHKN